MEAHNKNIQTSRRGFLTLSIATSLLTSPIIFMSRQSFASNEITSSDGSDRTFKMAKKLF